MKKNDTLNAKLLKPKQETIDFLLNFSKSIDVVKAKKTTFIISKN